MNSLLNLGKKLSTVTSLVLCVSCSQTFTVSVNDQAVYDPTGRLISGEVIDADLQGCINLAMRQQDIQILSELTILSCSNSEVQELENIGRLVQLRFLDLGNNNISNITPLEDLIFLGGLNLMNNVITDITPLLNIAGLVSVSLLGNNNIPCNQIESLAEKLGDNLTPPETCND
jgi:Leucine-rich repeat (LRR) protein